jgi:hypothetical protein
MREIDVFYAQEYSPVTEQWSSGTQTLSFIDACKELRRRKASTNKRIVRYVDSRTVGIPSRLLIMWQGKRVPEWLGGLTHDNTY